MSSELDYFFSHSLDSVVEDYINSCSTNLINSFFSKIKHEFLKDPSQKNFVINIHVGAHEWACSKIFENLKKVLSSSGWDVLNISRDLESISYYNIKVCSISKYIYR